MKLRKALAKAYCELFEISALYYITPWENLETILEKGLLCRTRVDFQNISHIDFADKQIQKRRSAVPVGGKYAHDYVPLFFHQKPPMLYRLQKEYEKKSHPREIVYVCINNEILGEEGVYFTDRNLATTEHRVFDSIEDLAKLRWRIIKSPTWKNSLERNIKGAEVLVPERVDPCWFQKIIVYDEIMKNRLKTKFPRLLIPTEVNRHEFYF